jgi:hypothetical protein
MPTRQLGTMLFAQSTNDGEAQDSNMSNEQIEPGCRPVAALNILFSESWKRMSVMQMADWRLEVRSFGDHKIQSKAPKFIASVFRFIHPYQNQGFALKSSG